MESENNDMKKEKQKLGVFDILKEAITIYVKNLNFIFFTFLTSLPLFCIMVYFETQLHKTLIETYYIFVNIPKEDILYGNFGYMLDLMSREYYYLKFIQLGLIYIFPLHVLEFGTAIVTINLASKLSSQQENNDMSLKEMFHKPVDSSKLRGSFHTFVYVVFLTATHQVGLLGILVVCNGFEDVFGMDFYLEHESCSFCIGGIYGIDSLVLSVNFSRGCHRNGLFIMLIFFVWRHFLRFSCYYIGGYQQGNGTFIQVGLFCMVVPLKWVVFMIYFHDCKEGYLEKKRDEELGKDVRVP
ncbi:uncharacterized protein LOC131631946 [Vicia villosa]|uniref:uncharacterized protein LOC131631946 n=1 Tax=Vicia villosa TaxID=3911 RepID=UPI00273C94F1|nr:uncharacterized protein LOC131631946 [Vicia villosa]